MEVYITITVRLLLSLMMGGAIGLERAFTGRPAGLRTHTLVCMSSCILMLFTVFQWDLLKSVPLETVRIDPTRMAQGIMTGIGFLGAGAIMKEKFSVRGLTTAASIWTTASIGIIAGLGFYFLTFMATFLTLIVLSLLGWFEQKLPCIRYGMLVLKFKSDQTMSKDEIYRIIEDSNVKGTHRSYHLNNDDQSFQFEFTIRTHNSNNFYKLSKTLSSIDKIHEFSVIPIGE